MNRQEVLNSTLLKKRFCKDCDIPITVYENPYFYKRLEGLDVHFDCIKKFDEFCKELQRFPNEQSFFEYYNELKETIINKIKSKEEFIDFNSHEFKRVSPKYPKKELYTEMNDKKFFISIDMKKANFSALHRFSPAIFDDCNTWEDYMRQFTDIEHIVDSKYIRQVIMGNCNPKRQTQYEYMIMEELLDAIVKKIPDVKVYSLTTDEIIFEVADIYSFPYDKLSEVFAEDKENILKNIKIELFLLRKVKGTDGWMKQKYEIIGDEAYRTNMAEFKCLDAEIYIQVIKYFYALDIEESDLVFYHNGRLGRFLERIKNPWEDEDYFLEEDILGTTFINSEDKSIIHEFEYGGDELDAFDYRNGISAGALFYIDHKAIATKLEIIQKNGLRKKYFLNRKEFEKFGPFEFCDFCTDRNAEGWVLTLRYKGKEIKAFCDKNDTKIKVCCPEAIKLSLRDLQEENEMAFYVNRKYDSKILNILMNEHGKDRKTALLEKKEVLKLLMTKYEKGIYGALHSMDSLLEERDIYEEWLQTEMTNQFVDAASAITVKGFTLSTLVTECGFSLFGACYWLERLRAGSETALRVIEYGKQKQKEKQEG